MHNSTKCFLPPINPSDTIHFIGFMCYKHYVSGLYIINIKKDYRIIDTAVLSE